jgi:hypothetical protein
MEDFSTSVNSTAAGSDFSTSLAILSGYKVETLPQFLSSVHGNYAKSCCQLDVRKPEEM